MRRFRTLALLAVGAGALALSACGSGPEVIVSDAGAPTDGEAAGRAGKPRRGRAATTKQARSPLTREPTDPDGKPGEVVAEIREELDDEPVSGDEALDGLDEPLDEEPSNAEIRDARQDREDAETAVLDGPRNESGEFVELDEAASLACADTERALTALDEGDAAAAVADATSAAGRADESGIAAISEWSEALGDWTGADGDPAVLLGFLSVCTDGGYEL